MNPFPIARNALWRHRLAVAALVVLIACAMALGVSITTVERGLRLRSARAADPFPILMGAKGSTTQLVLTSVYLQPAPLELMPASAVLAVQRAPGVAMVAPLAFGDYFGDSPIVGTTAEFVAIRGPQALRDGRVFAQIHEAVIGSAVPIQPGSVIHPEHGTRAENLLEHHVHAEASYRIVGRLNPTGTPWDNAILVPVEAVWSVHQLRHTADSGAASVQPTHLGPPWTAETAFPVPALVIKPRSVADAYRLRHKLRTAETSTVFPAEVLTQLYGTLGDLRQLLTAIAVGMQVLVLVAAMLALLAMLAGRRQTLAVLRALGAPSQFVLLTLWLEIGAIVFMGAGLGLAGGWLGAWGMAQWLAHTTGLAISVSLGITEFTMAGALLLAGLLAGVVPAALAYRQSVGRGLQ